jgi:ATP-dependent Zn protease
LGSTRDSADPSASPARGTLTPRHRFDSDPEDRGFVRRGGRAAEQVVLGEASTGASNDLAGATQLAIRMVREFGMSPKLGPVGFSGDGPAYLGQQEIRSRQYAEATQRVIDEEVERLLKEADRRTTAVMVNGADDVYVERNGRIERCAA